MANFAGRIFNKKQALEHEVKDVYVKFQVGDQIAAEATLATSEPIILTSVETGEGRNTDTFTLEVDAPAANTDDEVLVVFTGTADAIIATVTPNDGTNNPANIAAEAVLNLTADITLTSVALGDARNTNTFTLEVEPAAANPTDTILADFTGTAAAIICTITPNDGTNNGATPVDLTTAELVELINTGAVAGKTVTVTDASSLRDDQTAAGGDATVLVNAGEGDGVIGTFADGEDIPVELTTEEFVELINTGDVVGKNIALTDGSSLRALQTATGGDDTDLADGGEGDGEEGTFDGGGADDPTILSGLGVTSVVRDDVGQYTITLDNTWNKLKYARATILNATPTDLRFQLNSEAVASTKSISLYTLTGATPTEPADDVVILMKLELRNSGTPY